MFVLILWLLYTVSGRPLLGPTTVVAANDDDATLVYSRIYLRGLKRLENKRIEAEFIERGIATIERLVLTAAKQGLVQYTTEPFDGCDNTRVSDDSPVDREMCENIVKSLRGLVSELFPDSELLYGADTRQYTLKWD